MDGILLLDKPPGMRSNAALQRVKWLFRARKAGHTGSLDHMATGMLPICLGEATKLSQYLLDADKRYRSTFQLGVVTDTGDAEGEVKRTASAAGIDAARVRAALGRFVGEIEQVPPMHSALKHKGRRLYELAYEGREVEREPRLVTVHAIELLAMSGDRIEIDVRCSKGTYIRTLAADLGEALGCGAHVCRLRRLEVGPFHEAAMVTLEAVEAASEKGLEALDRLLLPLDRAVAGLPRVELEPASAFYIGQGQAVLAPRAPTEGMVRLYGSGRFMGVGEVLDDGRVAPRRLLARG